MSAIENQVEYHALGNTGKQAWEHLVLRQSSLYFQSKRESFGFRVSLPDIKFPTGVRSITQQIIQEMYNIERITVQQDFGETNLEHTAKRMRFYRGLVRQMEQAQDHSIIYSLMGQRFHLDDNPPIIGEIAGVGIRTLYLLSCSPTRFLVGTKGRDQWKDIAIPVAGPTTEDAQNVDLLYVADNYMLNLFSIGKREASVVPTRLILRDNVVKLTPPTVIRPILESLTDAFYDQHYAIPSDGAQVRVRDGGDVTHTMLMQIGDKLIAKLNTRYGELRVDIDLDTGEWISNTANIRDVPAFPERDPYVDFVAEVYHDLLTAEEVEVGEPRSLGQRAPRSETLDRRANRPQVIYIPRKIRTRGESTEPRIPYEGPKRPIRPHPVGDNSGGFRRRQGSGVSEKQLQRIREFTEETGIEVPPLKYGETWVLPYFVPTESGEGIKQSPLFIRRAIAEKLFPNTL